MAELTSLHIKVGGEAGFGIMASGLLLVRTFSRGGLKAITINDYPSLIRGGHNVILVKVANHDIFATDDIADILIALNRETIDLHKNEMTAGGAVVFDPESFSVVTTDFPKAVTLVPVPLMRLAKEQQGDVLMRNTVALGATLALIDYDFSFLESVIRDQFGRKGEEVVTKNVNLARAGYDFVKKNFPQGYPRKLGPQPVKPKQMVLTGNEAVGLGAVAAGMKFFAAYPMTPINGLLYYLAGIAEKTGFVYKQPEDEISGINMAIGASFAGARSMVATSGGGFCLMTEGVSLAGMIEQPVVVIYGQRPGPATGLPTWTTQGDLHFVLNASQGEFPRLVLAPGDMEEAYYLTGIAFNLAEKYQTPTFVLVDKYICESYFSVDLAKMQNPVKIERGKLLKPEEQAQEMELKRYLLTDDGISPRPLPIPGNKGGIFHANSDEHDEYGYSIEEAHLTKAMIEKRMKKMAEAQKEVPDATLYGEADAEHTLVGWGSTKGVVLEAMRQLTEAGQGKLVNYLHIAWVNPFPVESVKRILSSAKHIIDIEGNHNSPMADWILLKTGIAIKDRINKYDGRPFFPAEIITEISKFK
ncbi:MAG: Pyruvate flavodoxin/ferredoxin oxidoreductase-like protein [Candidatus Gottesmanbacteria bacterium GW2011_GWB1_43_11]|uniref:Pyruvate flavodoxin/ferredoxin oxidoreductase-like protein n=1 Tax=Candidatus Gottesmanbacteria bacterium GW2011_GWB1_43_11 TaxID=1618446 RepID=A0A0G1CNH0_9BACT|nr:MAG: Pyruvate flavodoxin/ferredoxin oxidoreductase-like protein [Candidatus Gottesmanbacteria bacterium GW2011_GWA2_42_16]KKS53292.1 MAG: Pyruvate flavodoxin/ferredoxin oxidoreductase-like protein [Candidatus Gottesmanbacteria bacterium GW2011_GWA1_42_26]KKS81323.1 MAG: Pyruvate flavodoxin/ferredoxin oxidoreductase-like protein [Candidatus Gottesmanbacteria bacterium GW2011_GWC1_43_10]KKS87310.1 MAG: Pyruvate flavodoxin/ferredoxin oxidoreductase-like protein [Candidatus Gottesmanbacteria bact